MTRVLVSVEYNFPHLNTEAARQLAKQRMEGRGLVVARTTIVKDTDTAPFVAKAGQPGSVVEREGRKFQVWSVGPRNGDLWVIPLEHKPGDAPIYLTIKGGEFVSRHHANGAVCATHCDCRKAS